jgi:hypothetical protein
MSRRLILQFLITKGLLLWTLPFPNGHLGTRKYLSDEKRADFKVCDHKGFIPIHSADSRGHSAILKYQIDENR